MSTARACKALWLSLLAIAGALPGCASGRVNLWPLYFREVRELQTDQGPQRRTTTEALYPIFTRESRPDGTWHAVRPFYNYEHGPEPAHYGVQYLWPLGLHVRQGSEVRHRFVPLFAYNQTWSARMERHSVHAQLLEIVRWGRHAEWGGYFALIPVGGVTHGLIGRTWSFVLFPLYSHYRRHDYVRNDFPWPFLGYGRSPDGTKTMYRFWPLCVYKREDSTSGLYVRHDLLWPLVRWGRLDRRGKHYYTVMVAAPVFSAVRKYNREGQRVEQRVSVLGVSFWPGGWSGLWSLVRASKEPRSDELRIVPFYWRTTRYKTSQKDPQRRWARHRILWPIVWIDSDRMTEADVHKKGLTVAPLYWDQSRIEALGDGTSRKGRRITLWPLFTWEREPDGGRHLWAASRGWKDLSGGFKRNYRAFFDLFQYHRTAVGERETRVLSRLYHHRRGPGGRCLSLMSLFTYDSTGEVVGEDGKYVSLLLGLMKCSWTEGRRRWRILYIPFGGGGAGSAEDDNAPVR